MTLRAVHLDDAVYRTGFTRGDVVFYYYSVAEEILAHLTGRDVTVVRYPDGVAGPYLLEPGRATHLRIDDADALVREVEHHVVELRAAAAPPRDRQVGAIDLRAHGPGALSACSTVAVWLREELERSGAVVVAVSDGAFGLQVRLRAGVGDVASVVHRAASRVASRHPRLVVTSTTSTLGRRVVLDVRPTGGTPTLVPYSLRAGAAPTVAAPLRWEEVAEAAEREVSLRLGPHDVLQRLELDGDLLAPLAGSSSVADRFVPTGRG